MVPVSGNRERLGENGQGNRSQCRREALDFRSKGTEQQNTGLMEKWAKYDPMLPMTAGCSACSCV